MVLYLGEGLLLLGSVVFLAIHSSQVRAMEGPRAALPLVPWVKKA